MAWLRLNSIKGLNTPLIAVIKKKHPTYIVGNYVFVKGIPHGSWKAKEYVKAILQEDIDIVGSTSQSYLTLNENAILSGK